MIQHADNKLPILLDRDVYKIIKRLDKKWYVNDKNHVYCLHDQTGSGSGERNALTQVYLHELVIKLNPHQSRSGTVPVTGVPVIGVPIVHINNIHFDNRIENLQFDVPNKEYSKNTKKKSRIINLRRHGIDVDVLPTYMWYLKPDQSHGDRFAVEFPNKISWRSTASKKVSLKYKLEEAKKYLRFMKQERPDLWDQYSMNGDLTGQGFRLYREYNMMIGKAGFMIDRPNIDKTDSFLIQDTSDLTNFEIFLLHCFDPKQGSVDVNAVLKDYESMMCS